MSSIFNYFIGPYDYYFHEHGKMETGYYVDLSGTTNYGFHGNNLGGCNSASLSFLVRSSFVGLLMIGPWVAWNNDNETSLKKWLIATTTMATSNFAYAMYCNLHFCCWKKPDEPRNKEITVWRSIDTFAASVILITNIWILSKS